MNQFQKFFSGNIEIQRFCSEGQQQKNSNGSPSAEPMFSIEASMEQVQPVVTKRYDTEDRHKKKQKPSSFR